jgi:hypothetical protein
LIKRLRHIRSELSLLRASDEHFAPSHESQSSAAKAFAINSIEARTRKGLKESFQSELDAITSMKNDHESSRRALFIAIADIKQRLSELKGPRHTQLQETLMQLRLKQRLINHETDACDSMQRQLQLACRFRYRRAQNLYKYIKSIDAPSAQLISSRWIQSSKPTLLAATNGDLSCSDNNLLKSNEQHFVEDKKTQLAVSIEYLLSAAIAATTPRHYRPNEQVESEHTSW